jgi:arsenate reductase
MQLVIMTSSDTGRAAMAAAFFNEFVDPRIACSIAAVPDPQVPISRPVQAVFEESVLDRSLVVPTRLTPQLSSRAAEIISLGESGLATAVEGEHTEEWDVCDPSGQPMAAVRAVCDEIRKHVVTHLQARGWLPGSV